MAALTHVHGEHATVTQDDSATALLEERRFPFFELSHELRDKIYADANTSLTLELRSMPFPEALDGYDECARIECALCANLLLVSKQFSQEYLEEFHRHNQTRLCLNSWVLSRLLHCTWQGANSAFVQQLSNVSHLDFVFIDGGHQDVYGNCPDGIEQCLQALTARLPRLSTIDLTCCLYIPAVDLPDLQHTLVEMMDMTDSQMRDDFQCMFDCYSTSTKMVVQTQAYCLREGVPMSTYPGRFEEHLMNLVQYQVTPSSGPYSWHGLELAIIADCSFTLNDVEQAMEEEDRNGRDRDEFAIKRAGYKFIREPHHSHIRDIASD